MYHFGVKGQKWGLRRYQNPDGTLTEEGKRRYYAFRTDLNYKRRINKESKSLIDSDERLKKDFGVGTDDNDLLLRVSKEYGINNEILKSLIKESRIFYKENLDYIEEGRKIARRLQLQSVKGIHTKLK